MKNRLGLLAVACLAGGVLPCLAPAQAQPRTAENRQDEVININRAVGEETSHFSILRTDNQQEVQDYISTVVELEHAVALEVLPHVLRAVSLEKGSARPLKYTEPDSGRTRYFIQVVTTAEQMPSIIETIRALDLPGVVSSEGDIKYHYRLKYRRASEVSNILRGTSLSSEGKTFADDETNTIYISDSVSDGTRNIAVAQFYDVPSPQVEFQVLAVEFTADDSGNLGLDWDAWKRALGGEVQLGANWFEGGDKFARLDALLTVDASALASFLNYTTQQGTGDVVTRTTITASNNRPGVVSSLRRIPSFAYTTTLLRPEQLREPNRSHDDDIRELGTRPVVTVPPTRSFLGATNAAAPGASALDPSFIGGEKSEGIFLVIQPTIGRELVSADIRVVVNSMTGLTKLGEPIVAENLVDTAVTLRDGQPFVLGGLNKKTVVNQRTGVPGLKEVPVIKYLFSVERERVRESKIYVVVTPRFVNQVHFAAAGLMAEKPDTDPQVVPTPPTFPAELLDITK